ncbi:MAG TPA: sugar transferase, partial [bacterium]|nr:sugar transferase [bacterium]
MPMKKFGAELIDSESKIPLVIFDFFILSSIYIFFFLTTRKYVHNFNFYAAVQFISIFLVSYYFFLKTLDRHGYYRKPKIISAARDIRILIKAAFSQFLVLMFLLFLSKNLYPAPRRITFSFGFAAFLLIIFRLYILRKILKIRKTGADVSNIVLIGPAAESKIVETKILSYIKYGLRHIKTFESAELQINFEKVKEFVIDNKVKEVIFINPASYLEIYLKLSDDLKQNHVVSYLVPDSYNIITSVSIPYTVSNLTFLKIIDTPQNGIKLLLKRIFDISASIVLLVLLFPFLVAVMIFIKLDSPGPVIFKQKRVGKKNKIFTMYKFRTMRKDAEKKLEELKKYNEAEGPIFKIKKDPRITSFGGFLRKFSIDELPQLANVLKGEMSLIGPRPPIPEEVEKYEDWQKRRFSVMQGITGLWQVRGRSDLSFLEMVKLDIYYIERWSFGLDLYILLK